MAYSAVMNGFIDVKDLVDYLDYRRFCRQNAIRECD